MWQSWQQQQGLVNGQNVERARAISVAVSQEVQSTITALYALAKLGHIDPNDLQPFYVAATEMLTLQQGWQAVRLVEPRLASGVVNTALPFGQSSALISDDWVRAVRETKRPAVSALRRDPATEQYFVSIGVPVMRDGEVRYILGARILAAVFSGVLHRQQAPPDGVIALMDAATDDHGADARRGRLRRRQAEPGLCARPSERRRKARGDRSCSKESPSFSAWSTSELTGLDGRHRASRGCGRRADSRALCCSS